MKSIVLFLFFISIFCELSHSQYSSSYYDLDFPSQKRKKPKNSMAEGTLYLYWGYNRAAYTKSKIHFVGNGYDFTLSGVKAKDRPANKLSQYIDPTKFTVPQFNLRIGYNFANYWNISLGYDHLKYVMVHGPEYLLNGKISNGIDANWSGSFQDNVVTTDENSFHYENTNGQNYIRAELTRVKNIVRNNIDNFTLSSLLGISSGVILSFNDFTFGGRKDLATTSLSGLGLSLHTGLRFEFFKHLFLQTNVNAGYLSQMHVKTRRNEYSAFAKQQFGYVEANIVLGALFYIRPTNSCDSCPVWR
jgi:hypothetical protein